MAITLLNAARRFQEFKKTTVPYVDIPENIRQAFNIVKLYENGIAKVEPLKKDALYDRCYLLEEINYIKKDEDEKKHFLDSFMDFLKTMNYDFKITIANEYQSLTEFLQQIHVEGNQEKYPDITKGLLEWRDEKLEKSNPNVNTVRCLTVTCRADSVEEAQKTFNDIDNLISSWFASWSGRIRIMTGMDRLYFLHSLICVGKEDQKPFIRIEDNETHDNILDILPISYRGDDAEYMVLEGVYMSVLAAYNYSPSVDPDKVMKCFSSLEYPSFTTLDYIPVPSNVMMDRLSVADYNNAAVIQAEAQKRQSRGYFSFAPSRHRQIKKDEIEAMQDQIMEKDEIGYFMSFLVVLTAPDEKTLNERIKSVKSKAKDVGIYLDIAYANQLKALNTALPYGGRQVKYLRSFLVSSIAAFHPYYAQDIIEPGGYMYGLNATTKRLIIGDRKKMMNPHGIIIGHSGSGKSVLIKITEILQTLVYTDDDILLIDPQNECADLIRRNGGSFFDMTPKSNIYLNGFEVSQEVFDADNKTKELFIATQTKYALSLIEAIMTNITYTSEHDSVVGRCVRRMYEKIFSQEKLLLQPTLRLLRKEILDDLKTVSNEHDREIILPIYNSMEEYTEGSCDMLAYPSNINIDNRLVGFGLKNVPESNWEAVMITIMHYTSSRMEYNQKLRRATHFIVDETQVVSRKGKSADQLETAVVTFRKFGGICTMAMQNLTAALANKQLKALFSNCEYKCFLDQGGVDANALAEIQELSQAEFQALDSDEVGKGIMIWGKKVVLFDAQISKENSLYPLLSTNFFEKKKMTIDLSSFMPIEE